MLIKLTYLSGQTFYLNDELIETIDSIPETKLVLTTGKFLYVRESGEEVLQKIVAYRKKVAENKARPTSETFAKSEDEED